MAFLKHRQETVATLAQRQGNQRKQEVSTPLGIGRRFLWSRRRQNSCRFVA